MRRDTGDKGQATVQFVGIIPFVLLAILLCFKIYITITTVEQVENAARTGAREASINHNLADCPSEAMAALPAWLKQSTGADDRLEDDPNARARATAGGSAIGVITCRVEAKVPVLWQGVPLNFTVDRTVQMPG